MPYLKPLPDILADTKLYTLVLDLDETLVHFEAGKTEGGDEEEEGYYMIRPGCSKFLKELS